LIRTFYVIMESLEVGRVVEGTLTQLRSQLFDKGAKGLHGVARAFRLADFDNSNHLDKYVVFRLCREAHTSALVACAGGPYTRNTQG